MSERTTMQPPDVAHRFHVALQERADKLLCAAGPATAGAPVPRDWVFQYVERPSFDDWTSRTIFTAPRSSQAIVRRHRWSRAKTFELISGRMAFIADQVPEPLIEVSEGSVPIQQWERLLAAGSALRLPPLPPLDTPLGFDGTSQSLDMRIGLAATKFTWWQDGPNEWSPLVEWTRDVVSWCDGIVAP